MLNEQKWWVTDEQQSQLQAILQEMSVAQYGARIWAKDASLWGPRDAEEQQEIENRLGWLWLPERCLPQVDRLEQFVEQVSQDGFQQAIVLGMGGSSLGAGILNRIIKSASGYLNLKVLDSTVPAEVVKITQGTDLPHTLFIVAGKSGTTAETIAFFDYFYDKVREIKGEEAGESFIAITDSGTPLACQSRDRGLRAIFTNWPDLGGRYSVLSYFGMVPAALAGLPIREILSGGRAMAEACGPQVTVKHNPALRLGGLLAACHKMGQDKVTFLTSPALDSFGDWAEQLLAESTGKEGKGLIPVVGEPTGEPEVYGDDRVFVHMRLAGDQRLEGLVGQLADAGHPVVDIELRTLEAVGQELYRWELATTAVGALLGINPFNQPNVQESKDQTRELMDEYCRSGELPQLEPDVVGQYLTFYGAPGANCGEEAVVSLLRQARAGDYVALMTYLPQTAQTDEALSQIRGQMRDSLKIATTLGYGPCFLHSTGQLHKGGPNNNLFIQLVATDHCSEEVPDAGYDFATLKDAQALGDFAVLRQRGRRVLRIELGQDVDRGLSRLAELMTGALSQLEAIG